jgi:hypothetical protein
MLFVHVPPRRILLRLLSRVVSIAYRLAVASSSACIDNECHTQHTTTTNYKNSAAYCVVLADCAATHSRFVFIWVVSRTRNIWTPPSTARLSCYRLAVYCICAPAISYIQYLMSLPSNIRITHVMPHRSYMTKPSLCVWSQGSFHKTLLTPSSSSGTL